MLQAVKTTLYGWQLASHAIYTVGFFLAIARGLHASTCAMPWHSVSSSGKWSMGRVLMIGESHLMSQYHAHPGCGPEDSFALCALLATALCHPNTQCGILDGVQRMMLAKGLAQICCLCCYCGPGLPGRHNTCTCPWRPIGWVLSYALLSPTTCARGKLLGHQQLPDAGKLSVEVGKVHHSVTLSLNSAYWSAHMCLPMCVFTPVPR